MWYCTVFQKCLSCHCIVQTVRACSLCISLHYSVLNDCVKIKNVRWVCSLCPILHRLWEMRGRMSDGSAWPVLRPLKVKFIDLTISRVMHLYLVIIQFLESRKFDQDVHDNKKVSARCGEAGWWLRVPRLCCMRDLILWRCTVSQDNLCWTIFFI